MNKILYILLSTIVLTSCNRGKTQVTSFITNLIGDWEISSINMGKCNECPKIIFMNNGSAKIIFPTSTVDEELMTWKIKNNILEISYSSSNKSHYIRDREYKLKFEAKKDYLELQLSNQASENVYILRR